MMSQWFRSIQGLLALESHEIVGCCPCNPQLVNPTNKHASHPPIEAACVNTRLCVINHGQCGHSHFRASNINFFDCLSFSELFVQFSVLFSNTASDRWYSSVKSCSTEVETANKIHVWAGIKNDTIHMIQDQAIQLHQRLCFENSFCISEAFHA